ncbi:hypothetical protein I546_5878 [Mycobacterium kansasii 732]|nr:hypothetical protein I546_5878 [Mycobacterium kansasii 732]
MSRSLLNMGVAHVQRINRNIARPPGAWLVVSDLEPTFHVARPATS